MKQLLGMLLLMSSVNLFAGKIVRNINWDNTTRNKSGSAVAESDRENTSILYNKYISDDKDFNGDDYQSNRKELIIFNNSKELNYEITASLVNSGFAGNDKDRQSVLGYFGKKFEGFNVGAYAYYLKGEGFNQHELGTSITKKNNDLIFGAGIRTSYYSESDNYHEYFYAGVGKEEKDKTIEAYIAYRPEQNSKKNGINFEVDKYIMAVLDATLNYENFQLIPHISYTIDEDNDGSERYEKNELYLYTSVEFRATDSIFIGTLIGKKTIENKDIDTPNDDFKESVYVTGINARYKLHNYQAQIDLNQYDKNKDYDTGGDDDEDEKSLTFTGTYFF